MQMTTHDLGSDTVKIDLDGRLDTVGAGAIELKFTVASVTAGKHTIVDLSGVEIITSMGIRLLVSTAKSLRAKHHKKFVVLNPQDVVATALRDTGIDQILPIAGSLEEAQGLVSA